MAGKMVTKMLVVVGLMATVVGCGGGDNNNSVTNPNPQTFNPKGTVTGVLRDSVTNDPIAGATIYILDLSTTTGAVGQFTLRNVPANTGTGTQGETGNGAADAYNVVINLNGVNNTRKANKLTTFYPNIAYSAVTVKYTSLGETSNPNGGAGSNHDTPVSGFVANMSPFVGKLDANVTIQVVRADDRNPVPNARIALFSANSNNNATGNQPHLVAPEQQTNSEGKATFSKVEAAQSFHVISQKGDLYGAYDIVSPVDGLTLEYLNNQDVFTTTLGNAGLGRDGNNDALQLASADTIAPLITGTTPQNLSDIASGATQVVFTFSEPIQATAYATALTKSTSVDGGLWKQVAVTYTGPKTAPDQANPIPIGDGALQWNGAMTQLTLTVNTSATALYVVTLNPAQLQDHAGNFAVGGIRVVQFSTDGGLVLEAPVVIRNPNVPNQIDWKVVPNAYSYNVYIQRNLAGVDSGYFLLASTPISTYTVTGAEPVFTAPHGAFSDLGYTYTYAETKIVYTVKVSAVNTDLTEFAPSNVVTLDDDQPPQIVATNIATKAILNATAGNLADLDADLTDADATKVYVFRVSFSEQMQKNQVEDAANWTVSKGTADNCGEYATAPVPVAPATLTKVSPSVTANILYDPTTFQALITVSYTQSANKDGWTDPKHTVFTFSGEDLKGNAIDPDADAVCGAKGGSF